jgi:hypothetical protein
MASDVKAWTLPVEDFRLRLTVTTGTLDQCLSTTPRSFASWLQHAGCTKHVVKVQVRGRSQNSGSRLGVSSPHWCDKPEGSWRSIPPRLSANQSCRHVAPPNRRRCQRLDSRHRRYVREIGAHQPSLRRNPSARSDHRLLPLGLPPPCGAALIEVGLESGVVFPDQCLEIPAVVATSMADNRAGQ